MTATNNRLKSLAVAFVTVPVLALAALGTASAPRAAAAQEFDAAAAYKAKCAACHGPKAEKKFDATKSEDELVEIVLKSKKPGMPAYETKGITPEQARAIIVYMKSLKQ